VNLAAEELPYNHLSLDVPGGLSRIWTALVYASEGSPSLQVMKTEYDDNGTTRHESRSDLSG
jgi:hypothetical protein